MGRTDGALLDQDDGRPRAGGNVNERGDHHAFELHSPLSKAPLFASLVIEREQLPGVSASVRDTVLPTYFAIILEVYNMPQDALGDFPD